MVSHGCGDIGDIFLIHNSAYISKLNWIEWNCYWFFITYFHCAFILIKQVDIYLCFNTANSFTIYASHMHWSYNTSIKFFVIVRSQLNSVKTLWLGLALFAIARIRNWEQIFSLYKLLQCNRIASRICIKKRFSFNEVDLG